ncbi:MAG: ImmA/IrrE family metallo-endopeptidase [Deltaproteobacteria bacterium]|nr:ImmA/IrrE family metallo-endopeptidase [Deltaproteobacteria bacterium]
MDLTILSGNLRRIRSAKNLSQAQVADAAGLSRVGYRNVESGASAPRVDTLMRVAEALGVRLDQLLAPVRTLTAVRFRAEKKMTTRGELLADVAGWLDDYNQLEALLETEAKFAFAPVRKKLLGVARAERPRKAAELARQAVKLGDRDVIRDICGLLEDHGVKVFTPKLASEGFFGLSVAAQDGGPAVVVNVWERLSVERWIFTAAHELGHLLLHLDAYDVAKTDEDASQEKEADTFASYFLMPQELFEKEFNEARGLPLVKLVFKLKRIFRMSWKSVLYRIASRSPDGGKLWPRFQWEYRQMTGRTLGKADEPDGLAADDFRGEPSAKIADEPEHLVEGDFQEDRLSRLVRRAVEAEEISLSRAAEILRVDLATMRDISNSWVA